VLTWEHIVNQAGSVSSSVIGSVLESVNSSVIGSVLRADFGMDSQPGRECAIECNWGRPGDHTWVYLRIYLEMYLGAY